MLVAGGRSLSSSGEISVDVAVVPLSLDLSSGSSKPSSRGATCSYVRTLCLGAFSFSIFLLFLHFSFCSLYLAPFLY